jgi:hypothetical protein
VCAARQEIMQHENYENALFNAMCNALEVLKQIHIAWGENVDETPVFKKREKQFFAVR